MAVKIQNWTKQHEWANIKGWMTVTRAIDPANNVNKYRRFIVLEASGEHYMLLTQTGRWTPETERSDWGGGSYKFGKVANQTQMNRHSHARDFLREETSRKLGGYGIHAAGVAMSESDIRLAINKAKLLGDPPAAAPGTPAPAPGKLEDRISALMAATHDKSINDVDLFADLSILTGEVKVKRANVDNLLATVTALESQLTLATKMVIER